jgi:hypothetical protein
MIRFTDLFESVDSPWRPSTEWTLHEETPPKSYSALDILGYQVYCKQLYCNLQLRGQSLNLEPPFPPIIPQPKQATLAWESQCLALVLNS